MTTNVPFPFRDFRENSFRYSTGTLTLVRVAVETRSVITVTGSSIVIDRKRIPVVSMRQ